jgi:ABC-type glutathione transport system ATPase component
MLDPIRAANTMANLLHLVQKEKLGLLFTSHDPVLARRVAHRILLLQEGRILTQVATYPLGQKK